MPLKWLRKHIMADGNCFYRAIFNSALETGNIRKIIKIFKLENVSNEETFIDALRNSVAHRILTRTDFNITENIYHYLNTLDRETYLAVLDAFPSWCQRSLKKLPSTVDKFREKFARHIQKKNTWISELEARLVLTIIEKNRLKIKIYNSLPKNTDELDCKTMNLLNENEVHYNILICRECPSAKIINPKTRRCITENGAIAKKLRKFY